MATSANDTIAFITTGGTIGAAFGSDVVTLTNNTGAKNVRDFVDRFIERNGINVQFFSPLNKFSEDFEPSDWGAIFKQIDACIEMGIQRIVIAHGTDTLVYSSFAVSLYYSKKPVRICFTAAFMPPSDPASDAFINIEGALQAVRDETLPYGVYFAFRSSFFEVDVFRAQDIKAIGSDETSFGSVYGRKAARFAYDSVAGLTTAGTLVEVTAIAAPITLGTDQAPTSEDLKSPRIKVVQIPCTPGMSLRNLAYDSSKEMLVILENYHSGTIPALQLKDDLQKIHEEFPNVHFVSSPHPYRYIKFPYETTSALEKSGHLKIYKDLLPHQLYVLALCESSKGSALKDVLAIAEPWRFTAPL